LGIESENPQHRADSSVISSPDSASSHWKQALRTMFFSRSFFIKARGKDAKRRQRSVSPAKVITSSF
jgi:hypothetical protein